MFAISALALQSACYTFQPSFGSTPPLGTRVALDVNDAGRVALGGTMAPEISRIEGRLVSADSSEYLVNVTGLRTIRGMEQVWSGEPVHVNREWVGTTYQQHFAPIRTGALVAATAGVVVVVAQQALAGFATPVQTSTKGDSAPSIRFPLKVPSSGASHLRSEFSFSIARGGRLRLVKRW